MLSQDHLQTLMLRSEGVDLDFKQSQYPFEGASSEEKAELLKDILAMANTKRTGDAYILVGVREERTGPAEVVGIDRSIDDAKLQQFVNSKVNRPVLFHYFERAFEGKQIGVFVIPPQAGPIYLKSKFANLPEHKVYVRHGSSTAVADPDEIARMGEDRVGSAATRVEVELIGRQQKPLPDQVEKIFYRLPSNLPDFKLAADSSSAVLVFMTIPNTAFWRELGEYERIARAGEPVTFRLRNLSKTKASQTCIEVIIEDDHQAPVSALRASDLPKRPEREASFHPFRDALPRANTSNLAIQPAQVGGVKGWKVQAGDVLPGQQCDVEGSLVIVPAHPGKVMIKMRVFAAELPEPLQVERSITFVGPQRALTMDDLQQLHDAMYRK